MATTKRDSGSPVVVGLGEVLWDCFPDARRPGGAPANVAFHARQLGLRGVVCSRVGRDQAGDELLGYLHDHGLGSDHIQRDDNHPTGTVTVHTDRADSPSYTIHENVAWDFLEFTDRLRSLFESAGAVCFGTLAQRNEVTRKSIARCLDAARNSLRVFDVNLRPPHYAKEWIEVSLKRADVVKLNDDEVKTLCPLLAIEGDSPRGFARAVIERYGISTVVVTRGADGCLIETSDEVVEVMGKPVKVADTVGAGDSFSAGLIYGLLNGWPAEKTAEFANGLAGLVASRPGAMPDLREELVKLRAEAGG